MNGCILELIRGLIIAIVTICLVVFIGLIAVSLYACGLSIALTIIAVIAILALICYLFFSSLLHLL